MKELSLFSGVGGGLLGSKILDWRCIGYVENNKYYQKVIKQRIADGILDSAPIFGDIRRFISEGWAERYRGKVDVITGGFPCQPFSVAGKGLSEDDPRNMWPYTRDVVSIIKPYECLFENVPGIQGYLQLVIRDLRRLGYTVKRPFLLSAGNLGADHKRERVWIFAYTASNRWATLSKGYSFNKKNDCRRKTSNTFNAHWAGKRVDRLPDSEFIRRGDGVAFRVDRLKAIGNGQVPLCMAYAYEILSKGVIR